MKESPYIEAARAYGAGSGRIIFSYLVPRIIPLLIPALVTGIPGYVFLEAGLAVLGLGDPTLPTWGKIINDAQSEWCSLSRALLLGAGTSRIVNGFRVSICLVGFLFGSNL